MVRLDSTCQSRNQDRPVDVILLHTDAVPKKRGPKTDVLEALLKRVDGLEAKLKEKKDQPGASPTDASSLIPTSATAAPAGASSPTTSAAAQDPSSSKKPVSGDSIEVKTQPVSPPTIDTTRSIDVIESAIYTPSPSRYANDYSTPKSEENTYLANSFDLYTALLLPLLCRQMPSLIHTSPDSMPNPSISLMSRPSDNGSS